ncbi:MAG: hypothetical protein HKN22_02475 [Bacteroidia bacterium]|nr:hypothetical protein [Bacteroidia bacterium]
MIRTKVNSIFPFSIICLFLIASSCANKLSPTGGEKDIEGPLAVRVAPKNYSTNFESKKIEIAFNEFVALKDLNKQLVISPIMDPIPEITLKRKTLTIKLPDSLKRNTTYTINFGDAIVDITESNPIVNFQYVFSTGNYIDSLYCGGKALRASDLSTQKDILIMLYEDLQDSIPAKQLPDYYSKTDENGLFLLNNLKAGTYRLIALKDNNNNFLYDLPEEFVGFESNFISLPDSLAHRILLSKPEPSKLKLVRSTNNAYNQVRLIFNTSTTNLAIVDLQNNEISNVIQEFSTYRDTVQLYVTDTVPDSLKFIVRNGLNTIDTVNISLGKVRSKSKGRGAAVLPFSLKNNIKSARLDYNKPIRLKSNYPIRELDIEKFSLYKDSVKMDAPKIVADTKANILVSIDGGFTENESYRLVILPNAIENLIYQRNDTIDLKFIVKRIKEYGNLNLSFNPNPGAGNFVLLLVDDEDKTKYKLLGNSSGTYSFNYLFPGSYKIKMFLDENNNGKLDPGNYWSNVQPERVYYYPETVKVRANWDVSISWDIELK